MEEEDSHLVYATLVPLHRDVCQKVRNHREHGDEGGFVVGQLLRGIPMPDEDTLDRVRHGLLDKLRAQRLWLLELGELR
jgi:hypothetical protein